MIVDKPIKDNNRKPKDEFILKAPIMSQEKKVYEQIQTPIPSKVMVIENLRVTINDSISGDFVFNVGADFAPINKYGVIPKVNITAREDIEFNEKIKLETLKSIIRRCGILEEYKVFFTNDPDIIINSYTLDIHKEYQFFDEFKDGLMTVQDIF